MRELHEFFFSVFAWSITVFVALRNRHTNGCYQRDKTYLTESLIRALLRPANFW